MVDILGDKSKKCACAFWTANFVLKTRSAMSTIKISEEPITVLPEQRELSPEERIDRAVRSVNSEINSIISKDLRVIKDTCGIDTSDAEKSLKTVKANLSSQIRHRDTRIHLTNNIIKAQNSIRDNLETCMGRKYIEY